MATIEELAGIELADLEVQLALDLARGDRAFLRRLVQERRRQRISQQDVADRLGITQPSVAAFERHDSDPKLSTVRRYAQVIGIMVTHEVAARWATTVQVPAAVASSTEVVAGPAYVATKSARVSARVKVTSDSFGLAA